MKTTPQQFLQFNNPGFLSSKCKAYTQQSVAVLRHCFVVLQQWLRWLPHRKQTTEYYTVTLQQLPPVVQYAISVLPEGGFAIRKRHLNFRNCKQAFRKLLYALRHSWLIILHCYAARLLCIHSPPFFSERLLVNSEE